MSAKDPHQKLPAKKPAMGILAPCACLMWCVCAIAFESGRHGCAYYLQAGILAFFFGAVFALRFLSARRRAQYLLAAFALFGVGCGLEGAVVQNAAIASSGEGVMEAEATLVSDPKATGRGASAVAVLDETACAPQGSRIILSFDEMPDFYTGATVFVIGSFRPVTTEPSEYDWHEGICGKVYLDKCEFVGAFPPWSGFYEPRCNAIKALSSRGNPESALLLALSCGYRQALEDCGSYDAFKTCGLAHLVAVSGAHLAIISGITAGLLRALRFPRWLTVLLTGSFLAAYLIFAGIPISAIRATVMVALAMSSGFAGRRRASLNSLAVCVIGFIAIEPRCSVSASLFLSAGSTAGIVMFMPLMMSWFEGSASFMRSYLIEPAAMTLSSNIMTLPYSISVFKQLPLISPLANVIVAPFFPIGCILGLVVAASASLHPPSFPAIIMIAELAVSPILLLTRFLAGVPFACIPADLDVTFAIAASLAIASGIWIGWPTLHNATAPCLLVLSIVAAFVVALPRFGSFQEIDALDVGQGDSLLIRSGTASMMVDTGNQSSKLKAALAQKGIRQLDALAITHPDDDHSGCIRDLASCVSVGKVLLPSGMKDCQCRKCTSLANEVAECFGDDSIEWISYGQLVKLGDAELECVWPRSYEDEGGNSDSLCLKVIFDVDGDLVSDCSALLVGDAENEQLKAMVAAGDVGDIDILKLGHHGSKKSIDEDVARALRPEYALVSVGSNNRYGHPSQTALSVLEDIKCRALRTDELGTVTLSLSSNGIQVK